MRVHGEGVAGYQRWRGRVEGQSSEVNAVLGGLRGLDEKWDLNCCPILLIVIRASNEWRASCKPLSGFFSHHVDLSIEPTFYDEEGRACLQRSIRQASAAI